MERARYCKAGAFVWPPRSYVCNFCSREFGSAQALGGHMNVHRRDRARLNQSTGISTEEKKPETAVIDGKKEKYISRKRWRCDEFPLPLFPFFTKLSKSKKAHLQEEVKGLCVGAAQELDLELRLGFSLI